jgi:hypothetical protein
MGSGDMEISRGVLPKCGKAEAPKRNFEEKRLPEDVG